MALGLLWAILLAVATNMIVGMLWYGPLFGKPWMKARGWDDLSPEEIKAHQSSAGPGYAISMASAVLATTLLWFLFDWATAAPEAYAPALKGAVLGFTCWLGFYVGPTLTSRFFEEQHIVLWALGAGYWGVLSTLYGVYVGIFA